LKVVGNFVTYHLLLEFFIVQ